MKRVFAMMLVLSMVLGLVPAVQASPAQAESRTLEAAELSETPRLDGLELQPSREGSPDPEPDAPVTIIVELEDAPLLEHFSGDLQLCSAGDGVAAYLSSQPARNMEARLHRQQDVLIRTIRSADADMQVLARWDTVLNGLAVRTTRDQLAAIREMAGVKRAYVEREFDRPVTPAPAGLAEQGWFGYSYDMVGVQEAWNAGFTGKGMLVAVLDTGLDLMYSTWGYSDQLNQGVRRTHEAFRDTSFRTDPDAADAGWSLRYTEASMSRFLNAVQLNATTSFSTGEKLTYENNPLFKNRKVPFAYDYADWDMNVQPLDSDHGTHVSGTIAGYCETADGAVKFSGIAPDAQLMMMKVFPDSAETGALESVMLNALEDAMALGADVVNLSLGSNNGYAQDDTATNDLYARMEAAGIILMTSAGNSGYASVNNRYGGFPRTDDPENNMISAPAVYGSNLAVASVENTVNVQSYLQWTDGQGTVHDAPYSEYMTGAMKHKFPGDTPLPIIPVDGYGTYNDYYNAGFNNGYNGGKDGIALVKRGGGVTFADKINNAMSFAGVNHHGDSYGILAVIIYDEDPNSENLIFMSVEGTALTSAFISGKDGAAIVAAGAAGTPVTMTVPREDRLVSADPVLSSFSSWGTGPSLELKPEITAPGGNIWSALVDNGYQPANPSGMYDDYVGSYGMMSGTSMAAPHMAGLAALTEQYVQQAYQLSSKKAAGALASQLLVSTALPQMNGETYYSPRQQGAGLVQLGAALTTPAYISADGESVGKLELLDDPERTGSYALKFRVNNLSPESLTYDASALVLRPATDVFESGFGSRQVMTDKETVIKEVSLGQVTVPALGSTLVEYTLELTPEEKQELDSLFANGVYVEGFISLTAQDLPRIGLPFLAFYGDWTAAPIFDRANWFDAPQDGVNVLNNESTWATSVVGSVIGGVGFMDLGQNILDAGRTEPQTAYRMENFAISPNGDGYLDSVNDFVLYQLRDAKVLVVEVHDKETGELYFREHAAYQSKSLYYPELGAPVPTSAMYFTDRYWDGTDLEGQILPSGTECVMTITAYGDGDYGDPVYHPQADRLLTDIESVIPGEKEPVFNGHAMNMEGDSIRFDIQVDTCAPKLLNNAVSFYEKDGRVFIRGTVQDDGSIASVEVHPMVSRRYAEGYGDPNYVEYGMDHNNPFFSEFVYDADAKTLTFEADVTEYTHKNESYPGENRYYQFDWTGNIYISMGDYGINDRTYAVTVNASQGLVLSQTSALLHPGSSFVLSVNDNTGLADSKLVRSSSNPAVATVDEFGEVKALAAGQTNITVTAADGSSAVCVVAVEDYVTEVTDFRLSVESFHGLKPNGTFVVKVQDLEPANVVLESKRWVVMEDDEELYSGLLNVGQNSGDGLEGQIYLNYSATNDPDIQIMGSTGTLTVTLNGVSRSCSFDWEDLYTQRDQDDLISDLNYGDQSVYVRQGETAQLIAKYNNAQAHTVNDVLLLSEAGDDAENHLTLDGPDFVSGQAWSAVLVNDADYALPDHVRMFYRYDNGYEYELTNSWRTEFTYDAVSGKVELLVPPTGATVKVIVKADAVSSPGTPAGTLSGTVYEKPDPVYGPFLWNVVSGGGNLTTEENVPVNGYPANIANYTPDVPGVSVIQASTKDGRFTLNFTVISEPVLAETLTLSQNSLTMEVGETAQLTGQLAPEPTLAEDQAIIWKSFAPDVAEIDENGQVTAVSEGYAYLLAVSQANENLHSTCIVKVGPVVCEDGVHTEQLRNAREATCTEDGYTGDVYCSVCGELLKEGQVIPALGHRQERRNERPATCTETGYTGDVYCSVCGDLLEAGREIPAAGHRLTDTVVPATCTEAGYTEHRCTVCGYTFRDSFTEPGSTPCPSARFTDVDPDRWYHAGIDFVLRRGIMVGTGDTTFSPASQLTRGQLMAILYRMAEKPAAPAEHPFADARTGYYAPAIAWAYEAGIAAGVDSTHFAPSEPVTREQMVTFLARYAVWEGKNVETDADLDRFADQDQVSSYARQAMAWAVENGILMGCEDDLLAPEDTATRAQAAGVIMHYCSKT